MARHLLASHLLDAVAAVVNTEDLLAPEKLYAEHEDVLADEHVSAVELATHRELASAHVRHQQHG